MVVRTHELRAREVVERGRHRPDAVPERVPGRVQPHLSVLLERVERRHAEELEVVQRLEVGPMYDRGPLRLDAQRDARARESCGHVADERHVWRRLAR